MDNEFLYALIALIIGWLLNEFSHYQRKTREEKKELNVVIHTILDLIFMYNQFLSILNSALSSKKLTPSSSFLLTSLLDDENFNSEEFYKKIIRSIEIVSKYDPFLSQELRIYLSNYDILKFIKAIEKNEQGYQKRDLESQNMMLEIWIKKLRISLDKLIRKHSIYYWYKIRSKITEFEKNEHNEYDGIFKAINKY